MCMAGFGPKKGVRFVELCLHLLVHRIYFRIAVSDLLLVGVEVASVSPAFRIEFSHFAYVGVTSSCPGRGGHIGSI